ncbi:MAG: DUF2520 domain-containing protein, partial [Muribaculaceae bacterium]|nr:DUF2520 domain-containing protein [Muribaculaceae bacterium]
MARLIVFNPEHDYALASARNTYTNPASLLMLKKRMVPNFLPLAGPGDLLLLPEHLSEEEENVMRGNEELKEAGVTAVSHADLKKKEYADCIKSILPWGWDFTLLNQLRKSSLPDHLFPSEKIIETIQSLSHRRTSIDFNNSFPEIEGIDPCVPVEFTNVEDAMNFLNTNKEVYFKAPWSSSGRGVINSSTLSATALRQWISGTINRQGSVIGEPAADRLLDFATEWKITDGEAEFLGFSLFSTDKTGHYRGNTPLSSAAIFEMIRESAPYFSMEVVEQQKKSIDRLISPYYSGPLGIDMLVDKDGNVRPCVEINLRMTMGHVQLSRIPKVVIIGSGNVGTHLVSAFRKVATIIPVNPRTLADLPEDADYYIISVKDSAVEEISDKLPPVDAIVAHTSGSIGMEALSKHRNRGVFYPMQTFTKGKSLDYGEIPLFIEGNSPDCERKLTQLASLVSNRVALADSERRRKLHIAAVFSCNFVNRLCGIASDLLNDAGLDFKSMLPLIHETLNKLHELPAETAQTGPAVREDKNVMDSH